MKTVILTILILLTAKGTALADPQDDRFMLEGLQQRGLFSLIEYQCKARINDADSTDRPKMAVSYTHLPLPPILLV